MPPYRRRRYWSKPGYKRKYRPWRGRINGGRLLAARKRRRNLVVLRPESKYVDAGFNVGTGLSAVDTSMVLSNTVTVYDFNGPMSTQVDQNSGSGTAVVGIPAGSGFSQRIGRKIFLKYMSIRMLVKPVAPATFSPLTQTWRVMLLYDRQPNLALPAAADIMQFGAGAITVLSFQEDKNRDRFVRLWDYSGVITIPSAGAANDTGICLVNKKVKINAVQTYSDSANGGIGTIQTGSLVFVTVGDADVSTGGAGAPSNGLKIELGFRLRYLDL